MTLVVVLGGLWLYDTTCNGNPYEKGITMRIESKEWGSRYGVTVNDRHYIVDNIHIYDASGIVASTGLGWFERKGYPDRIKSIELPVDEIKLRRKPKFDGVVFVMLVNTWGDTMAELYIPCDMLGIRYAGKEYNKGLYQLYDVYEGGREIHIKCHAKFVDGRLNELRNDYEKLHEASEGYKVAYKSNEVLNNLTKMQELVREYIVEKARLDALTVKGFE